MRNKGFTVIELMIALLIVAILAAIAVPSFRSFIGNSKVTGATNDFVTALNVARSTALQRAIPVTVCASANQSTCSGSTNWATGWIAFTDNEGAAGQVDGAGPVDVVLQVWAAPTGNMTLTGNAAFIRYDVTGAMMPPAGSVTNATAFTFNVQQSPCASPQQLGRTLVNVVGSIKSSKVTCP